MGLFEGKVALVTGGARGQGRSHALALAREGADIVSIDLCRQVDTVEYAMSSPFDHQETVRLVEGVGRRILAVQADVREAGELAAAVEQAVGRFGRIDFVVANAGIMPTTGQASKDPRAWVDAIDTMLSGVYYTLCAVVPVLVRQGDGGSIVLTGSTSSRQGVARSLAMLNPGQLGYGAAKHGIVGLMRNYAMALGPHRIRVNCVHPMGVRTPMVVNEPFQRHKDSMPPGWGANVLGVDIAEPGDVSDAVVWLCSDHARLVTGVELPVDAGTLLM